MNGETLSWEYRDINCRLFHIGIDTIDRWIGYARFADEWIEVIDTSTCTDVDSAQQYFEEEVDRRILKISTVPDNGFNPDTVPDPDPSPYPDIDPDGDPPPMPDLDPVWMYTG